MWIALVLTVIHFVFLMLFFKPAISTPDANGYFAQAKLIAREGKTFLEPESGLEYIGPHWLYAKDNSYFTTFPPGLPVILAIVYKVLGPTASLLLIPLLASLSLFGLFLLCRSLFGGAWGLLAFALMTVNPFANEHALFADSHTVVIFFLIWSLVLLVKWIKTDSPWWALGAGFLMGVIPAIRYPEALFPVAFGVFALMNLVTRRIRFRSFIAGVIGMAVPILVLAIRNQVAFGAFWKTGYGLSHGVAHFGLDHFIDYALPYLLQLCTTGGGLVFISGIIGIVFLCVRRETRNKGILFAMLAVPVTLVYMSYFWAPDPQSMRFLLPTFFIYAVSGVWLLKLLAEKRRILSLVLALLVLFLTGVSGLPGSLNAMQRLKLRSGVLADITKVVEKRVEEGSILIAGEGIDQHLDFIGRWKLVDKAVLRKRPEEREYSMPGQDAQVREPLRNVEARPEYENLADNELFEVFTSDVQQWAAGKHKVYLLADEEEIYWFRSQLPDGDMVIQIERIEIPEIKPRGRRMPRGARPREDIQMQRGPMGQDRIFDLTLNGEPLYLLEWKP